MERDGAAIPNNVWGSGPIVIFPSLQGGEMTVGAFTPKPTAVQIFPKLFWVR